MRVAFRGSVWPICSKAMVAFCALSLTACASLWPEYESPKIELPEAAGKSVSIDRQWWKAFGSSELDALIDDALIYNFDLAKAAANVAEARANTASAASLLKPRVDGIAGVDASRRTFATAASADDFNREVTSTAVGAGLSWEIDLWGRIRQLNDAALARLAASEHARNATTLSISTTVAETYFQLLMVDNKVDTTRRAIEYLRNMTDLEYRRWKAGMGTQLAYRQSLADLASTEARMPNLVAAQAKTALALRLLVGSSPRELTDRVGRSSVSLPNPPSEFDSSLLLRRPDVASAEQMLVAAHADVNAARAEIYPKLNLSILAGFVASTSTLVSGMPLFFDARTTLIGPIYDGGLVQSKIDGAEARREKALAHYRYTVSLAFKDAYEALIMREAGDKQIVSSDIEVQTRRTALSLTQKSYEVGRSSKFEVLAESIKVLNAELTLEDAKYAQLVSRSQYYKALGGGF
jgi:outer membrane protein, multidrug efflux system